MKTRIERNVTRTLEIAAPRPQVFRALLDPGTLSRWLFASVNLTPEQGSEYSFEWRDSAAPATASGQILELIADTRLVLSWFMEADGVESTAAFDLEDAPGGGTRLNFVHAGLPQEPEWLPRLRQVALEWDKVLLNLRFLLEEKGEGKHLFYFRTSRGFPAALPRVFRAFLTPTGLSAWLAREVFLIPEEGHDLTGITLDTGRALNVRFHRIEPDRHLRMTWSEGGVRGLIGVSFWPGADGVVVTLTLRSFALMEGERPILQALWDRRFDRLLRYLERLPLAKEPAGTRALSVTREVEGTPQRAWAALTDASILRRLFVGWTYFEPRPGADYTILWNSYGELRGKVKQERPGESIRMSWDIAELGETTDAAYRVVPHALQPGRSAIEVTHGGFGSGGEWDEQLRAHEEGWTNVLAILDFYLRHGAGREPRELHLRRRLPLPMEKAIALLTTPSGLTSWLASRAELEPKPGGACVFTAGHQKEFVGRFVVFQPQGESSIEFTKPEPLFLNWFFAPDPDPQACRVAINLTGYGLSERWFDELRGEWAAALDRLAEGKPSGR